LVGDEHVVASVGIARPVARVMITTIARRVRARMDLMSFVQKKTIQGEVHCDRPVQRRRRTTLLSGEYNQNQYTDSS